MAKYMGVDISFNNTAVDYQKLKDGRIDGGRVRFAMIRTSYGQSRDPMLDRHYQGCKAAGIYVGGYHWLRAQNPAQAREEAEWLCGLLKNYEFDYPIALDFEDRDLFALGLSRERYSEIIDAFMSVLQAAKSGEPVEDDKKLCDYLEQFISQSDKPVEDIIMLCDCLNQTLSKSVKSVEDSKKLCACLNQILIKSGELAERNNKLRASLRRRIKKYGKSGGDNKALCDCLKQILSESDKLGKDNNKLSECLNKILCQLGLPFNLSVLK